MSRSVRTLPAGYRLGGKLDLNESRNLAQWLNLLALPSLLGHMLLFSLIVDRLRPSDAPPPLHFEGDLVIVAWLLRRPTDALVDDYGDGVAVYVPA
jgi:uncharacterized Tic20 family protein